ncbi:MAG: type IX secretion system protein PorQ [Bacteroidia bacterium]
MKRIFLILIFSLSIAHLFSQTGGQHVFQFLNLTNSARISALGGNTIAVNDNDANMALNNPSLLKKEMDGFLGLNYMNYFAGINYGYTSFTKHYDSVGTFNAAILYANYGNFEYADEFGFRDGSTFTANDMALVIGYGKTYDSLWTIGANLKLIGSFYETYSSYGAAVDLAATYHNPEKRFTAAFVLKNVGYQFKDYTRNNGQKLPIDAQAGISYRLAHAPLRFSAVASNLQRWDLTYYDEEADPQIDPLTGEEIIEKRPSVIEKTFRHLTFGTEVLLTENFHIRLGYNYRRRQELKLADKLGTTGISWGFGFNIKKFNFGFSRSTYHLVGGSNHFTAAFKI